MASEHDAKKYAEGWLEKKSTKWVRYWTVLRGHRIFFFKEPDTSVKSNLVGHLELQVTEPLSIVPDGSTKRGFEFSVVARTGRYFMKTETEGLREMWLRSLQLSIYNATHQQAIERKASISASREQRAAENSFDEGPSMPAPTAEDLAEQRKLVIYEDRSQFAPPAHHREPSTKSRSSQGSDTAQPSYPAQPSRDPSIRSRHGSSDSQQSNQYPPAAPPSQSRSSMLPPPPVQNFDNRVPHQDLVREPSARSRPPMPAPSNNLGPVLPPITPLADPMPLPPKPAHLASSGPQPQPSVQSRPLPQALPPKPAPMPAYPQPVIDQGRPPLRSGVPPQFPQQSGAIIDVADEYLKFAAASSQQQVPANLAQSIASHASANGNNRREPDCFPYYFGAISRATSESYLNDYGIEGSFLLRASETTPGDFSLSVREATRIRHNKIQKLDQFFNLHGVNDQFLTLSDLMDFFIQRSTFPVFPMTQKSIADQRVTHSAQPAPLPPKPAQYAPQQQSGYPPQPAALPPKPQQFAQASMSSQVSPPKQLPPKPSVPTTDRPVVNRNVAPSRINYTTVQHDSDSDN